MSKSHLCNTVEAKARLNELLDEVVQGNTVTIMRYGEPVAQLVTPSSLGAENQNPGNFFTSLKNFHKKIIKRHGVKSHTVDILREIRENS